MATVLLVEDDVNLREIYAARLSADGLTVVVASDGEEALAKAVKEKPDLILLDIMMPKISGFDVLDILRSTPETQGTKVIMLTALSQPSDRARGEKLGVNKFLVKSQITLEDVAESVKNLLAHVGVNTKAGTPETEPTSSIAKKDGYLKPPPKPAEDKKEEESPQAGGADHLV